MDAAVLLIQKSRRYIFLAISLILAGCANYSFDINNNEVYSPPRLFSAFDIADPGLEDCIRQTVSDQKITSAESLENLTCSHAGIISLDGLSQFSRLVSINLRANQIQNVDELLQLTHLRDLDLTDNPISSCQTLGQLEDVVTGRILHSSACP
jgi:Leucine-rich repeat (LRR) protein